MEDNDIEKIRKVLMYNSREDLADLLRNSTSYLDQSSKYGSRAFSLISTFEIKSHPSIQYKLDKLPKDDIDIIKQAVMSIYPVKDEKPEITKIRFSLDFDIDIKALVETKELARISFEYIHNQIRKCNDKITEKDFDGAITNARTLIESICLFIIEAKTGEKQNYDGNVIKLYKTVAFILKMSPGDYEDEYLRQILSGVFSIINGVSGLRNTYSDSHGTSPSKANYQIDERHSILTVNLAKTITEYLFLSFEKSESK